MTRRLARRPPTSRGWDGSSQQADGATRRRPRPRERVRAPTHCTASGVLLQTVSMQAIRRWTGVGRSSGHRLSCTLKMRFLDQLHLQATLPNSSSSRPVASSSVQSASRDPRRGRGGEREARRRIRAGNRCWIRLLAERLRHSSSRQIDCIYRAAESVVHFAVGGRGPGKMSSSTNRDVQRLTRNSSGSFRVAHFDIVSFVVRRTAEQLRRAPLLPSRLLHSRCRLSIRRRVCAR
jgi:hypothetical protein